MAVVVVGDVDPVAIQKQIEQHFGDLANPAGERARPSVPVPPQAKAITLAVQDPELPITVVAVASKQPHRVVRTEADMRAELVDRLFSTMLNQRLDEIARKPEAPFLAAGVGKQNVLRPIDVWFQGAVVKGDRAEETLKAVATELARVGKFGFTESEIARARQAMLHTFEVAAAEKDKTESRAYVEEIVRSFLTGEAIPGTQAELALARKLVPSITAAEIQGVAARAASEENRLVIAAGNSKTRLPAEAALLAAVAAGRAAATTAYADVTAAGPLVPRVPKPGTVKSEKKIPELGVTEWTFDNGVRVILKPTDFKNDQVLLAGFLPGGMSLAKAPDLIAARNADEIAAAGGAGTFTAVQIEKALAGTGVGVQVRIAPREQSVEGAAQPDHLQELLQLVYLRLTSPRKDDAALGAWRAQQVEARKQQFDDPGTVFASRYEEIATRGDPRFRFLTDKDYASLDLDRALDFFRARVAHLGGFTFVLVGNFDVEKARPLLASWLGGLPAGAKPEHEHDQPIRRPSGEVAFEVKKGVEPKSSVRILYHRTAPWSRESEYELRALADTLAIRLREELREGMSGTYGVGVNAGFDDARREATVEIEFGCAPDSVDALVGKATSIVADFQKDGPPAEVVAKVQESHRREREVGLKDNGFWLEALWHKYRHGDDPRQILQFDKLIDGLSVDHLRATARRFLGKDRILGVLRPEGK
jgi:zinc protease